MNTFTILKLIGILYTGLLIIYHKNKWFDLFYEIIIVDEDDILLLVDVVRQFFIETFHSSLWIITFIIMCII